MMVTDEQIWSAIGDASRRRTLDLLLELGASTPTTLARELPISRQAVAKHLAVLDRVGLVHPRRNGREVRYTADPERVQAAVRALANLAREWDNRLAEIKSAAEEYPGKR